MIYTGTRRRKRISEINVVPYVDVTFVLLVIFVIATPLFHQGVEVELPDAPAESLEKTDENQEPLIVSVDQAGRIFVNKADSPEKPIMDKVFGNQIREILSNERSSPIYVRGDKNVDYGRVVAVMVMLQEAGAENVGLITHPAVKESEN